MEELEAYLQDLVDEEVIHSSVKEHILHLAKTKLRNYYMI